ncbi:Beta-lactamase-like domain-containing protein [Strongyloides ratti]|uniref:Metallo-beta-lactamase domain-containing protein 1 n=1 Tax=Strongyloides ratti TaxID=34506 RepID=A0A090MZZ3_STRRB|nr:Beta-lactamase-like domain-containing protein [Strongyloides ratti]CEF69785.1 Beta-lactamase-like domain-containing protein [Strongyloides ratti]
MTKLFLFLSLAILLKTINSEGDDKQFIRGRGHGSISKISMTSLVSSEVDDIFEDVKLDNRNQYGVINKNSGDDELNGMIDLTEQKITVGPSKTIRPNIILPNNEVAPKKIESSLLNLSGSNKIFFKKPNFLNSSAPLKTLIMPHSIVEKKSSQENLQTNDDLTDEEVVELTKYVEKYISNANFREYIKNNLQTETLFVTDRPSLKATTNQIFSTTTLTSTTTTTISTTTHQVNKKLHGEKASKEKLKQFKEEFNKWLDELRKKASNVSRGIEVNDSPNSTINKDFVLKSDSIILQKLNLEKIPSANVRILQPGYLNIFADTNSSNKKNINMSSTITLIQDMGKNILVDTGLFSIDASGRKSMRIEILRKLNELLLSPSDIHYVIITSSHIDHIGNLNEFGNAIVFQNDFMFDQKKDNQRIWRE